MVKAVVEVAPVAVGEGGRLALRAVGLDVTAEWVLHEFSLGVPPGGIARV